MEFKKGIHYNQELESAILGACLIEKEAVGRVYGLIEEDYFYFDANKQVWAALKKMYQEGIFIDILTLSDYLTRKCMVSELGAVNVLYYLTGLTNSVVSSVHMEYHAFLIKTMWMEREVMRLTNGGRPDGDVHEQIKKIQEKIYSLQQKSTEHDWNDMTQLMVDLYRHQENMKETKGIGKPSGISILDRENGGFHNGQLVVVGARPSVGKSALVSGMAIEMAKRGFTVGIISLEMSNVEIAARLAAYDTNTDFNVVYRGLYKDMDEAHGLYKKIGASTSTLPIYVSDKTKVSVPEIRAKAEKLKALHGLDCLMIDYLQLVSAIGGSYTKNRENEIAEMSRGCKIMAKELDIPVVLICQLNREVTKRKGQERYPQLSDLRESGAIEQDADVVIFLHRDYMSGIEVDENGNSTEFQADLVIRKWRNGKSNFIIPLDFDPPKMKFTERKTYNKLYQSPPSFYEKEEREDLPF